MIGWRRLSVSFLNTLEKKGRMLIDLYKLRKSAGFLGLSIVIIIENFQSKGKYESLSME